MDRPFCTPRALFTALALSVACAAGCDDAGDRTPGAPSGKAGPADVEKPTAPASTPAPAPVERPLAELFPEGSVGLPTPLAGVTFAAREDEVGAAVPALKDSVTLKPEGFSGVTLRVQYYKKSRTLRLVHVQLPAGEGLGTLRARWGEPTPATLAGTDAHCWLDADGGEQALLTGDKLLVQPLRTRAQLIGEDKVKLGFEREPLVGMKLEQVKEKYAAELADSAVVTDKRVVLNLPPAECVGLPTFVDLRVEEGVVTRVHLKLEYPDEPTRDAIATAIQGKFGEPLALKGEVATYRRADPKIVVAHEPAQKRFDLFLSPK